MRLRFGAEFPFIRDLSISDLELKHHLSAEPVNFRTLLSAVATMVRHLQTTFFRNSSPAQAGRQLSLSLRLRFVVHIAHDRFCFSSASNGGKLSNSSPYGIVAFLETTKPSRRNPQRLVVSSAPLELPFGTRTCSNFTDISLFQEDAMSVLSELGARVPNLTPQRYELFFNPQ